MTAYIRITIPDPVDPAALIVAAGAPRPGALRDCLRAYADHLTATGVFADLTARDTRQVAAIIAEQACWGWESDGLRDRAAALASGSSTGWHHPQAVARVLTTAATVLDA